jgi:hypothetical protein
MRDGNQSTKGIKEKKKGEIMKGWTNERKRK